MAGNIARVHRKQYPADVVKRHNARHGIATVARCAACKRHGTAYLVLSDLAMLEVE